VHAHGVPRFEPGAAFAQLTLLEELDGPGHRKTARRPVANGSNAYEYEMSSSRLPSGSRK
jgi:hypothetical protein